MIEPNKLASDIKLYLDYSQYDDSLERYLTYEESVDEVYKTHCEKYSEQLSNNPELMDLMDFAFDKYRNKYFLGSNRALQWSGAPLLKHEIKMYNCVSGPLDKPSKFGDIMYMLLGGCGVGFSVQRHHIEKLPDITNIRMRGMTDYVVEDSIEGWAKSAYALVSSYFKGSELEGHNLRFDYSKIRDKDTLIAGRFKAPGPEGLRRAHQRIVEILERARSRTDHRLKPIEAYDIVMHIADAVISGGVRRSATICMFSKDDEDMRKAKTGNWFVENPQRARSNNSMVIKRDEITLEELKSYIYHIKQYGEPGIILVDDYDVTYNPCFTEDEKVLCNIESEDMPLFYTMKELSEMTAKGIEFKAQGAKYNTSTNKWERGWYDAKAFKTGKRVIGTLYLLDENKNEYFVQCTPNHKFALGNGEYIEARYLHNTEVVSSDGLKHIAEFFVYDDRNEEEDVYDLNVPETSNFYVMCEDQYDDAKYCEILVHNCVEIGMYAYHKKTQESGWQGCNLVEINGKKITTKEIYFEVCKAAAILATLQAGYTNFEEYLGKVTKEIFEQEALIGVSVTGWLTNPSVLLNPEVQRKGAEIVKYWNKKVAAMLGINPSARCTTSKPSGNSSVLLELIGYPGVKASHADKFFRSMQINKDSSVAKLLAKELPDILEESVWSSTKSDYVISLPIESESDDLAITDEEMRNIAALSVVKTIQDNWIKYGKDIDLCVNKTASHNVSNTISVDEGRWEECIEYIFDNKESFTGISMLSATGDMDYCQAPYTTIKTPSQLISEFGDGAILASGLIVDGLHAFDNNFWLACDSAMGYGIDVESLKEDTEKLKQDIEYANRIIIDYDIDELDCVCDKEDRFCVKCYYDTNLKSEMNINIKKAELKLDWIKRFKKFANNYMQGDLKRTSYLMKYVYTWHKYVRIKRALMNKAEIDWSKLEHSEISADTMGASSCAGGACEVNV